jgi:hypothetical protein
MRWRFFGVGVAVGRGGLRVGFGVPGGDGGRTR